MLHRLATAALILIATAAPVLADDSLYDDYYNYARQPAATPSDNDSYYTPPANGQPPQPLPQPQPYNNGYYQQPQQSGSINCNTVADVPSCGSD